MRRVLRKRTPKQMLAAYMICMAVGWLALQGIAWFALHSFGLLGDLVYIIWLSGTVVILFAKDVLDVILIKFRKRVILNHPLLEHSPYSALVAYLSPAAWISVIAAAGAIFGFCKDLATLK